MDKPVSGSEGERLLKPNNWSLTSYLDNCDVVVAVGLTIKTVSFLRGYHTECLVLPSLDQDQSATLVAASRACFLVSADSADRNALQNIMDAHRQASHIPEVWLFGVVQWQPGAFYHYLQNAGADDCITVSEAIRSLTRETCA
jgi:hypothetical protein